MSLKKLLTQIKNDSDIWQSEIHGLDHWNRVLENGLWLGKDSEAELKVIEYFSYLHDCCRENEGYDPRHGQRAAIYAKKNRGIFDLDDNQFILLTRACAGHTFAMPIGQAGHNSTLAICWDADRLDLGRIGIRPDPEYLFSIVGIEALDLAREKFI